MKVKVNKLAVLLVATVILVGFVVGCAIATPQTVVVEEKVVETVEVVVTPTAQPEVTEPVYGGTLRVGVYQDFTGLLPASGGGGWPLFVIQDGFYDPLFEVDQEMHLQPGLAKSWEISDDNMTITLYLQEGVQFHDGTPFNAEAAKFNLDRFINPEGGVIWDLTDTIKSVEVIDEYTVELTLHEPSATLLYDLAQDPGMMISPTALQEKGEDWVSQNPVGTGPFMFESWEPGTEVVMVRNPDYWREGLPYLDRIEWKIMVDNTVRGIALASGQIDLMTFVPPKDYAALEKSEDVELWLQPGQLVVISLNNTDPPFNIKENREAVRYALDYEPIISTIYYGLADLPTGGNFPPGMWTFDESRPRMARDLEKAKQLLAEAGNPDGFSFDMVYEPDAIGQLLAEAVQANLAEIGVEANLIKTDFARFIEIMQTDHQAVQAMIVIHGRMRANPEQYFTADWMSDGSQSFCNWNNEALDNTVRQASRTFDHDERLQLLHEAEDMFIEDIPGVPICYPSIIHATNSRVQGYSLHPWGELRFRWLWLKPESS